MAEPRSLWGVGGGLTGWEPGKGLGGGGVRISARAFCGAGLMGASDVVEEVYVYEPPRKLVRCRVACQEEASPHTDACNDSTVVTERVSTFHFRATTCACMSAYVHVNMPRGEGFFCRSVYVCACTRAQGRSILLSMNRKLFCEAEEVEVRRCKHP